MTKNRYIATEEQYGETRVGMRRPPLLYRIFKKFEIHRVDRVSDLIFGKKRNVLEIGCGDGGFLFKNKEKWKGIIGVDVIQAQLQRAKSKSYGCPTKFMQLDFGINPMPFKTGTIELIVSISTIQYILDLDLFFSESYRVLKKHGEIIIETPNSAVFWKRLLFLFGHFPKTTEYENKWNGGVIHYFSQENLCSFLRKKGFRIELVECSGILAKVRSVFPGLLGADLIIVAKKI